MTNEDEILFEQHFKAINMSIEERNIYIALLMHTKEMTDSIQSETGSEFDIVDISFKKIGITVKFNGIVSNGIENKIIDGIIKEKNNEYFVYTNIYNLYEYIDEEDYKKHFDVTDVFTVKEAEIIRKTTYGNNHEFNEIFDDFIFEEIDSERYAKRKVLEYRKGYIN